MPRGGARPGAGRKRTRDLNAAAIEKAEAKLAKRLQKLVDIEIALAQGEVAAVGDDELLSTLQEFLVAGAIRDYTAELMAELVKAGILPIGEEPEKTERRHAVWARKILDALGVPPGCAIYRRPPDGKQLQYCINRVMGSPTSVVETVTNRDVELLFSAHGQAWREAVEARIGSEELGIDAETAERIKADADQRFGELCENSG